MSYTIHKVGEAFSSGITIGPEPDIGEVDIVLTETVAADECVGFAIAGGQGGFGAANGCPGVISHANMIPLTTVQSCFPEYPGHINGVDIAIVGATHNGAPLNTWLTGADNPYHSPNPAAGLTQLAPVSAPIAAGDTVKVRWCANAVDPDFGTDTFQAMAMMLYAVKTDPPILIEGSFGDIPVGCSDMVFGGVRGNAATDPARADAVTSQTLKAFGYQNPDYSPPDLICSRSGESFLIIAAVASYTTDAPSYNAGWTEELVSSDGGVGVRLGLVLRELDPGDFAEYDLVATWGADVEASAVLMQVSEDTPPAVWFNHAVGFH